MDTRCSTKLKKIVELMEADKKDMEKQMKAMQEQIQELVLSNNRRQSGDNSNSGESVNKEGKTVGVQMTLRLIYLDTMESYIWIRCKRPDALSQMYSLLNTLQPTILGFDFLKGEYPTDPDFRDVFSTCQTHVVGLYHLFNGFLFRQQQLCIPRHSLWVFLIKEIHEGGLAGHQGIDKTVLMLWARFFWPKLTCDMEHFIHRCLPCHRAKSHSFPSPIIHAFTSSCRFMGRCASRFYHRFALYCASQRFIYGCGGPFLQNGPFYSL